MAQVLYPYLFQSSRYRGLCYLERSKVKFTQRWYQFFDKPLPNFILRLCLMAVGLVFVALGVALSRATGLGTSTISCVPATLSYITSLTIGTYTFLYNLLFLTIQACLLRRKFNPMQLFQIPFVFVFAFLIDVLVPPCANIPMSYYPLQLLFTVLSCCSTAFGVFLQVKASLIMLPGDGVVLTISRVFHKDFAKCKIAFDSTNVILAVSLSLFFLQGLYGVREGTIIAAVITGLLIKGFGRLFKNFEKFAPTQGHITLTPQEHADHTGEAEQSPLVITISREYGSGGRELGHKIGKLLNMRVYDRSLIALTAEESGLTAAYVQNNEEDVRRGILYNLYAQNYEYIGASPTETDTLFLAQARTITRLADTESCIIVGRNANYLLAQHPNCFNIFVHAPLESRITRVMARDNVSREQALARIERIDQERRAHCRTYTNREWGAIDDYDIALDSSIASIDVLAHLVVDLITDPTSVCRIIDTHQTRKDSNA